MFVGMTFPFFGGLLAFFGGFAFAPTTYFVSWRLLKNAFIVFDIFVFKKKDYLVNVFYFIFLSFAKSFLA